MIMLMKFRMREKNRCFSENLKLREKRDNSQIFLEIILDFRVIMSKMCIPQGISFLLQSEVAEKRKIK